MNNIKSAMKFKLKKRKESCKDWCKVEGSGKGWKEVTILLNSCSESMWISTLKGER